MKFLWQQIPSPLITEILCSSSFDGVILDLEHGHFNDETLYSCIQIGTLMQKKILARFAHLDKQKIRMCLDANISGVILSTVENSTQAEEFYNYCIYPPSRGKKSKGTRGQGLVRENLWGEKKLMQRRPIIIAQIETLKGVTSISSISKINFDYYLVGPYDLSASLGDVGNLESPQFKSCMKKLEKIIGQKMGFHIPSKVKDKFKHFKDYPLLALGMDTTFIIEKINETTGIVQQYRTHDIRYHD